MRKEYTVIFVEREDGTYKVDQGPLAPATPFPFPKLTPEEEAEKRLLLAAAAIEIEKENGKE